MFKKEHGRFTKFNLFLEKMFVFLSDKRLFLKNSNLKQNYAGRTKNNIVKIEQIFKEKNSKIFLIVAQIKV